MIIETYILCHNEELLLPYIVRHYSQYGKIIILENNSTDNTVELAKRLGCEVWIYDIPDEFDETVLMGIRNNCWKNSQATWVMVVDSDEFIYHPNLVKILEKTQATIFEPMYYNMFSEKFPTTNGQIYDEVQYGVDGMTQGHGWKAKMNLFKPKKIREMNWGYGMHFASPKGDVKLNSSSHIKTLHMKFLSRKYTIDNLKESLKRNSVKNEELGIGIHLKWDDKYINNLFEEAKPNLIKLT